MKEIVLAILAFAMLYVLIHPKSAGRWLTEMRQGLQESADAGTEQPRAAPSKTAPVR